ncbi:hypothetical protein EDWATA_00254 [Edwardsiella tarda ATCC 23685]|uniref:Uncharacterized protein n=1 Tax=Edwardsiella tarda ATCC 23685 TaxID=500638 RepID=D4F0M6_EDWTA|nr:hypothetical protein EDWATA_00254 [Edwardsiella tarda ATCC 23685]
MESSLVPLPRLARSTVSVSGGGVLLAVTRRGGVRQADPSPRLTADAV